MAANESRSAGAVLVPLMLQRLTRLVARHPIAALCVVGLVTAFSLGVSARFLRLKTDRSDLIDPAADFQQRWLDYVDRFGDGADAVVVLECDNSERLRAAVDDLGPRLEAEPESFAHVFYRIEPGAIRKKSLQYLSPRELESLMRQLDLCPPLTGGDWNSIGLAPQVSELTTSLSDPVAATASGKPAPLPRAGRLIDSLSRFLEDPQDFRSPWPVMLEESAATAGAADADPFATRYLIADRGRMGFVLAVPIRSESDLTGAAASIDRLHALIGECASRHPEVQFSLTGVPVLETDEMQRSQWDMSRASLISFIGVGLLLFFGFRGFKHPLLAMLMLGVGIAWSLGFTTLVVGHLNILSMSFAAILIGLGIDNAIHYIARYLELRHSGLALCPALVQTSMQIGSGIVTSSLTTAAAFFSAMLTSFLGVAELGIIAGGGILLCTAATFVVLPALIGLADRRSEPTRLPAPVRGNWVRRLATSRPRVVAFASGAAVLGIACCGLKTDNGQISSRVTYDGNLLNLQAEGVESVETMNRIADQTDGSFLYAVSMADGPEAARRARDAFLKLPTVGRVEEAASMLPAYPARETQLLVQGIQARLSQLPAIGHPAQVDPSAVGPALERLFVRLGSIRTADAQEARVRLDAFLDRLEQLPLDAQVRFLTGYEHAMRSALRGQLVALSEMCDSEPVTAADLPPVFRERFVSPGGDWLLKVYARSQLWDEEPLAAFVSDLRTVDPNVTGTPLQNHEAARQIRESYLQAGFFAAVFVFLAMLLDTVNTRSLRVALLAPVGVVAFAICMFSGDADSLQPIWLVGLYSSLALAIAALFDLRNVCNTLLAMIPPFGGSVMLFGLMGLFGIDLNPANLIVLPLILGMGVDYGVYVVHDFRAQTGGYRMASSTISAILMTSLTSMIGFGSLLMASHQGLVSLGLVLLIGIGCCMLLSLLTLPALLTMIAGAKSDVSEASNEMVASEPAIVSLALEMRKRSA